MESHRRTAATVGILFIAATACYMVGQTVYAPITGSPEALELAHLHRTRVVAGILVELVGVLAIPLIALVFYPILRLVAERAALSYVGIRILESVGLLGAGVLAWATVDVSAQYELSQTVTAGSWEVAVAALGAVGEASFLLSVAVVFPIGALVLNAVLWRFKLVPRVISGWGMGAAGLLLAGSLLDFFGALPGVSPTGLEVVLSGPIALQEMALAGWLIAKGVSLP